MRPSNERSIDDTLSFRLDAALISVMWRWPLRFGTHARLSLSFKIASYMKLSPARPPRLLGRPNCWVRPAPRLMKVHYVLWRCFHMKRHIASFAVWFVPVCRNGSCPNLGSTRQHLSVEA